MKTLDSFLDEVPNTREGINLYLKLAEQERKVIANKLKRFDKIIEKCHVKLEEISNGKKTN